MAVTSIVKMLTGTKVRQALLLCLVLLGGRSNAFVLPQNMARTNAPLVPSTSTRKMQLSLEDSFGGISGMLASLELPQSILSQLAGQELPRLTSMDELWLTAVTLVSHLSFLQEALLFIIPVSAVIATAGYRFSFPDDDYRAGIEPYERGCYNPEQARAYYAKHPKVVVQRVLQIYRLSNKFITALLLDKYVFKREEGMREKHAKELLSLITLLGPTAIKVGQALSVRPDIIPTEYAEALSTLQDQVPPFSCADARRILMEELGPKRVEAIKGISQAKPVASASIGQVYKGTVDGREVAVKVQRPNVLSDIALDLFLVRELAPLYQKYISKSETNLQALVNEWGRGFIGELDYRQEAKTTKHFTQEMTKRNLDAVMAPNVLEEYSTERILVTEWIDGVRIDRSESSDIPRLCGVALNAYLIMLLELQYLHCDPHPGNLLRTKDGRLCILDFGMVVEVDPTLQYSLLEYIAHCTSENYDKVPEDLVNMGFIKAERLDFVKRSGVLEPLVYFLKQAGEGGGAEKVRQRVVAEYRERFPGLNDMELRKRAREEVETRMQEVALRESLATGITTEVEELQRKNQDAFAIPEWFVYTSRAFITLEGVSLQADENYSLIQSCFPYIAKRLVKDEHPRAQQALKELLYGAGDLIDLERLEKLADGFSTYSASTKAPTAETHVTGNKKSKIEAEAALSLAKDSADVLLDPKGNLVQNLLVEEGARAASARVKDQIREVLVDGPQRLRDSMPLGVGILFPKLPFEDAVAPFVQKTEHEENAQKLVGKIRALVQGRDQQSIDKEALNELLAGLNPEQATLIVRELGQHLPKYTGLVGKLGTKFVAKLFQKASDNIDTTLADLEDKDVDRLMMLAARGVSSMAQHGARLGGGLQLPRTIQTRNKE